MAKRYDVKKQGGYEANYNAGWVTTDESTALFELTAAEATVLVDALHLLVLERQKSELLNLAQQENRHSGPYYREQYASPETLLVELRAEKPVEDIQVQIRPLSLPNESGQV